MSKNHPSISHLREQLPGDVRAQRLEPALGVRETRAEGEVEQTVVTAGDDLALAAAHDAGRMGEPGPDRDIAVTGDERRDERKQRVQSGREVDVHVADDVGVALRPRRTQRPSPSLLGQVADLDAGKVGRQSVGDRQRPVDAGVVGDHDPPCERQVRAQERVQPTDRPLQCLLLVVDGNDDVDRRPDQHRTVG